MLSLKNEQYNIFTIQDKQDNPRKPDIEIF